MGLEVYYPQDIRNALLAAEQSSGAALLAAMEEKSEFARGYQEGYRSALTTIALAFGLLRPDGWMPDGQSHEWQMAFLPAAARSAGEPAASRRNGRNGQSS
ncbi:MAG: hypothetical protein ACOYZ7_01930 [Chloroflexota bacterium]